MFLNVYFYYVSLISHSESVTLKGVYVSHGQFLATWPNRWFVGWYSLQPWLRHWEWRWGLPEVWRRKLLSTIIPVLRYCVFQVNCFTHTGWYRLTMPFSKSDDEYRRAMAAMGIPYSSSPFSLESVLSYSAPPPPPLALAPTRHIVVDDPNSPH